MARRPTPIAIRKIRGNPGRRPIPKSPDVAPAIPSPPGNLDPTATEEWERVAPLLCAAGVLTLLDRAALAAYCVAWSRWYHATSDTARSAAGRDLRFWSIELGLTPSSRSRVTPSGALAEHDDPVRAYREARPPRTA